MTPAADAALVGELRAVMRTIDDALDAMPPQQRRPIANTLLALGLNRILDAEGPARTATLLLRLADAVAIGLRPRSGGA